MKTYRIIASGRVQGVFFRQNTKKKAIELMISGSVRNLQSGDVEIYAQGREADMSRFIGWCRDGPASSRVDDLAIKETEMDRMEGFNVIF